jgi:hypothetical protein
MSSALRSSGPRGLRLVLPVLPLLLATTLAAAERWAPHAAAGPVDQLAVAGNACGPAAVLTSMRCGGDPWRRIVGKIPGDSDRSKLLYVIKAYGLQPSTRLKNRKRWSPQGINLEDLAAIARELAAAGPAPAPRARPLGPHPGTPSRREVRQAHDAIRDSLKAGFPPVLNLRRLVRRDGRWQDLEGHFVSVMMVPDKLPRAATSFAVTYFDPWGGRRCRGRLRLREPAGSAGAEGAGAFLIAEFPEADIGKDRRKAGEASVILATALIHR